MPTRWIDQGAASALVLAEVPNRYLSGVLEVELNLHAVELIRKKPEESLYFIYLMMTSLAKKTNAEFSLDDVDETLILFLNEAKLVLEDETEYKQEELN